MSELYLGVVLFTGNRSTQPPLFLRLPIEHQRLLTGSCSSQNVHPFVLAALPVVPTDFFAAIPARDGLSNILPLNSMPPGVTVAVKAWLRYVARSFAPMGKRSPLADLHSVGTEGRLIETFGVPGFRAVPSQCFTRRSITELVSSTRGSASRLRLSKTSALTEI